MTNTLREDKAWRRFALYIIVHAMRYESEQMFEEFLKSEIGEICLACAGLPGEKRDIQKLLERKKNYHIADFVTTPDDTIAVSWIIKRINESNKTFDKILFINLLKRLGYEVCEKANIYKIRIYKFDVDEILVEYLEQAPERLFGENRTIAKYDWMKEHPGFTIAEFSNAFNIKECSAIDFIYKTRRKYGVGAVVKEENKFFFHKEFLNKK